MSLNFAVDDARKQYLIDTLASVKQNIFDLCKDEAMSNEVREEFRKRTELALHRAFMEMRWSHLDD